MDVAGAEVLRQRLAQQENWRQAVAVRVGSQPAIDPDGHALESFCDDVRHYRDQHRLALRGGRTELVTLRIGKRLIAGVWVKDEALERDLQVA